jgi:4-amino-4-deoxy-L-arabinose transferase-like glycosyltransferase
MEFQPLWWDEGYSVWFATHPLSQMVALTAQDIHPPLYYALLGGWISVLGPGPIPLRLFSVFVGTLAVPLIYIAGYRMSGPHVAVLAASLLAINPFHIFYSQEVRMYGLMALLSIGILTTAWYALTTPVGAARPRGLPLYVSLMAAALYTQYYGVFLLAGITLYALWHWRRQRRMLVGWLAAQAVVALLYLPWIRYAGPKLLPYVSQKVVQDADKPLGFLLYFGRHLSTFLVGHLEGPLKPYWPLALLLLIPLAAGLWASYRFSMVRSNDFSQSALVSATEVATVSSPPSGQDENGIVQAEAAGHQSPVAMLGVSILVCLLLGWLVGLKYPFFPDRGERLLLLALPVFLLLAALSLDALGKRVHAGRNVTLGLLAAATAFSLTAFYLVPRYTGEDYRPLIARTIEQGLPGDIVFAVYPWQVGYWRSYGDPAGPTAVLTPDPAWGPTVMGALDAALNKGRVWFPAHLALGAILESRVEDYLAWKSVPFLNEWYGPTSRLSGWAVKPYSQPADFAGARFFLSGASAIELAGVIASPLPVPAANTVTPLSLRWRAAGGVQEGDTPPVLDVSVRLTDALGQTWAQHDYEPLGGLGLAAVDSMARCDTCSGKTDGHAGPWQSEDQLGLLIPAGTPPGNYTVVVNVLPKGSARPLTAVAPDGSEFGTSVPLYRLTVLPADRPMGSERLPIGSRQEVTMQDGLRFLGHSGGEAPAAPGELQKVSLFWQAAANPTEDYVAFLQLLDRNGKVAAGWEAPPGAGYPTGRWVPGTIMRTQAFFRAPTHLPDGRYPLIAGLFRASDGKRLLTASGADHIQLGNVELRSRAHDMTPPHPANVANVPFGPFARLVGYDVSIPEGGVAPGGAVPLTLYWQALGTAERPYTVFVHLLDPSGAVRGYGDGEPGQGRFPTTGWLQGEYLADFHDVTVEPDALPGNYRLAIGLYDPETGQRLATPDGSDQFLLDVSLPVTSR